MEPIIYGLPISNYVRSVRMLCAEKGISYQLSLGGKPDILSFRRDLNPQLHPFAKVPVLEHEGFRLWETSAILRYLDEVFPGPDLVPAEPQARARMEQWISAASAYFDRPIIRELVLPAHRARLRGRDFDHAAQPQSLKAAERALQVLDAELQGADGEGFVAGAALSLADLLLTPIVHYARGIPQGGDWLARMPALRRWLEAMEARPSFAAACEDPASAG